MHESRSAIVTAEPSEHGVPRAGPPVRGRYDWLVVTTSDLDPRLTRALSSAVAATFATDPVAGAVAGLVSGDHLVWRATFGHADVESARPVELDTVFRAASI